MMVRVDVALFSCCSLLCHITEVDFGAVVSAINTPYFSTKYIIIPNSVLRVSFSLIFLHDATTKCAKTDIVVLRAMCVCY